MPEVWHSPAVLQTLPRPQQAAVASLMPEKLELEQPPQCVLVQLPALVQVQVLELVLV